MTLLSRIMGLFPAVLFLIVFGEFFVFIDRPNWMKLAAIPLTLYGLPVLTFRIHGIFFPNKFGVFDLRKRVYSAWWGGLQIQWIFIAFPSLETILRLFPGLYSLWLRCWGSKVGRNIYWSPNVRIEDRDLMKIGDNVIFGNKFECYAHLIKPKGDRLILYVKPIEIGNNVFIGGGARMGPGIKVEDGTFVPILTDFVVNQRVEEE